MAVGSLRQQHLKEKIKMFSFRVILRSITNHPVLLVLLIILTCSHRYSPFLFSLLVSASPVLICTAILLGTLLIHGKQNDNNMKHHYGAMSNTGVALRAGVGDYHPDFGDKEGNFYRDRFAEIRNGIVAKGMKCSETSNCSNRFQGGVTDEVNQYSKGNKNHMEKNKNGFDFANFDKASVQMSMEKYHSKPLKRDQHVGTQEQLDSGRRKQASDTNDHQYETNNHESSDCESDGVDKSSFDALVDDVIPTAQETHPLLDFEDPLHLDASHDTSLNYESLQYLVSNQSSEESGEEEKDDEVKKDKNLKAKDNGDKLHNEWMDLEKNQQIEILISKTNDERDNEEEEIEDDKSIEDVEIDDDDDDDEDKENQNLGKDASNQVTMWTEEDEKNMRLVRNSEFERDLRLENLLAKRKAKRNFSMISERNMIDLDRHIPPFKVAPISTTRFNPFDSPVATNQHHYNIPPVPGSAPSVSIPKMNPFDSPCTSPKGFQDTSEDFNIKEEPMDMNLNNEIFHGNNGHSSKESNSSFMEMNRKDTLFRRYESFNPMYSYIGETSGHDFMETNQRDGGLKRHETFNTRSAFPSKLLLPKNAYSKMRPLFIPEHVAGDQEVRNSSSSHDSDYTVSSSESDPIESLSTLRKHTHPDPSKVMTASTSNDDHASSHSEDTRSESSDTVGSHDDLEEVIANNLDANEKVHVDQMHQEQDVTNDQNHDNASSSSFVTPTEDCSSKRINKDEDEDEKNSEYGLSSKASSNDTIEPPVYDTSPSGTEKSTPFSSTH